MKPDCQFCLSSRKAERNKSLKSCLKQKENGPTPAHILLQESSKDSTPRSSLLKWVFVKIKDLTTIPQRTILYRTDGEERCENIE